MRRRPRPPNLCIAKGCGREIPRWQRLCDPCFRRLPFDRRRAIAEAGQAKAPHIVARLTAEAAAWLADHTPAAEAARRMGEAAE
jgi:hypothetical protein